MATCFHNNIQSCQKMKWKDNTIFLPFISKKICQETILIQLNWEPCLFWYCSFLRDNMEFMLASLYCRYLHNLYLNLYHVHWWWAERVLQKAKNWLLLYNTFLTWTLGPMFLCLANVSVYFEQGEKNYSMLHASYRFSHSVASLMESKVWASSRVGRASPEDQGQGGCPCGQLCTCVGVRI